MAVSINGTSGITFNDGSTQSTGLKYYTSSQFSFAANTDYTFAHGFGAHPKWVNVYLICTVAHNGFAVGDRLLYTPAEQYSNGGIFIYTNTSTINLAIMSANGAPYCYSADTNSRAIMTYANWQMLIQAYI